MFYDYDFVRVTKINDKERALFINAIGVIVRIYGIDNNLYEVKFQQKRLRDLSDELGELLWAENELEAL